MKKLILLILLCLPFQASAWNPMVVMSGSGDVAGVDYSYYGSDAQPAGEQASETFGNNSYVFDEPFTVNGYIVQIEVFPSVHSAGDLEIGVCTKDGNDFNDEHSVSGLTLVSDTLRTFTHAGADFDASDLPVAIGEYLCFYVTSDGQIERSTTGGPGYWFLNADAIGDSDADTFAQSINTGHEIQIRVYISSVDPA